jgi:hypothetical protein
LVASAVSQFRRVGLRFTPPFPVVVVPVVVAAAAVVVLAGTRVVEARWPAFLGVAVLLLAATVAEWFPVPIVGVKAGMTSLATLALVATGGL